MNRIKKIVVFLFIASGLKAQVNLVPNPSFESYTTCPNGTNQLNCTGNWANAGASTDYYNACSPAGNMSVPSNIYAYRYAPQGVAYIGLVAYVLTEGPPYGIREPTGTFLTNSLIIGQKYFVSFKASPVINQSFDGCCFINKLGALFSTLPFSSTNKAPVNNFAHVYSNTMVTDTTNWTTISGSFIADSAYTFVSIGNFFDSLNTQVNNITNNFPQTSAAYYFIDDIRVSTDSSLVTSLAKSTISPVRLEVFPNPASDKLFILCPYPKISAKIYNSFGEAVISEPLVFKEIDISKLPAGFYHVLVSTSEGELIKTTKIQKQ